MSAATPAFWRDAALPYIEARAKSVRRLLSIGAVNSGTSTYVNQGAKKTIGAGTVVLMSPEDANARYPSDDHARMAS